ncbi:hypothetical protein POSPLADRAFT_1150094 [Postia placenta MAD-698-R-SB12]|uniref:F-box domain-containing protein n=1 Tax=Postia placenta MAD-698-R-SB12 TaxID=670580 RepID=A0A1X6MTI4_9APHY|nr:hypothetical protein POSPLADRAFT_1150094 [Postia placenta MAD-698-R-SB12]OSX59493.1 hypothetical protein POSPLADRAFT_1150094 [Postia placenta MAD-698-R-SB12]
MSFVNRLPLTIASCYEVVHLELTRDEDHGIIDDDLAHIIPWCPNLETVRLTGIPDLTDRTVILLARTASQLLELDISGCIHITDTAILELAKLATDLEAVKLNGLATLTDPSISALARSLTELSELEICNLPLITPLTIRAIWTFSAGLKRLKVAHCTHLTDKAFPYPPPLSANQDPSRSSNGTRPSTWLDDLPQLEFSPGHKLSDLRLLDLSYCVQLTDIAIAGIVAYAPRIQHLNLSGCMALSDSAAEAIATLGSHLNELTMPRLGSLTDRGVVSIVRTCTQMKSVDVSFNSRLTDLAVMELATLQHLQRLSVVGLKHLTDNAVLFLAEHTPTLERLHISRCRQLGLDALHVVLRKLGKLEHLSVSAVPALKRRGVERFSERPPPLYHEDKHGIYRVYRGENIHSLRRFLDKELGRLREAEEKNIVFVPRADDSTDLY